MFKVHPIAILNDNYVWTIIHNDNTVIVDPGTSEEVIKFHENNNLHPTAILITHHHNDHVGGLSKLIETYNVSVYAPQNKKFKFDFMPVKENDEIKLFNNALTLKVAEVPGHTLDHIIYFGDGMLFCGDTLFSFGCGRVFEGSYEEMFHSVMKVKKLPAETIIYCGHEYTASNAKFCIAYDPSNKTLEKRVDEIKTLRSKNLPTIPTTIKNEIDTNIFLRCDNREIRKNLSLENSSDIEVFIKLRKLKDNF